MKLKSKKSLKGKHKETKKDLAVTYNEFKEFEGKLYTGMKIGRSHKWYYDKGEWKEKKVTPERWEFHYDVKKRRAGKAPEGSGVPVGTEYHWYILHTKMFGNWMQMVYSTAMNGVKIKLAHKRSDKNSWSASTKAQSKKLIKVLQEMITQLESEFIEGDAANSNDVGNRKTVNRKPLKKVKKQRKKLAK